MILGLKEGSKVSRW